MASFKELLKEAIGNSRKIVILGVGSVLRADDAAGSIIAARLVKKYPQESIPGLRVYDGGNAPENFTGAIRQFGPDRVIIVDAADLQAEPGSISLIDPQSISGASFSTHMLPLKFFINYLKSEIGCDTTVIGVQPLDLTVGAQMTSPVKKAVSQIIKALEEALAESGMN